jgi:uncharacterized protein YukE
MESGDKYGNAAKIRDAGLKAEAERYKEKLSDIDKKYKDSSQLVTDLDNLRKSVQTGNIKETEKLLKKFVGDSGKTFDEAMNEAKASSKTVSDSIHGNFNTLNNKKVTVKVDADTANANTKVSKLFTQWNDKITNLFSTNKKADGGVFSNGRWHDIEQYAGGGLPPTGQMFVAREKGPELVGKIGSSTAVMNNAQIVESVKAGVYEAVSSAMSQFGGSNVSLDITTEEGIIVKKAINGINKIKQTTGECPIDIW